ncbi:hypothetical protein Mth01_55280 [Sphaerimonospora thailandensis]|uniref:Lantibiotic dehydratase N-terminal domain-containing protein n=2 Tax=Sphaerimonospora thailandensis TaxID=795644 RepID=A0A8J3REK5_9ACTN|nr:hypothetical protein Mth01_55280 [Sphaerimonospora thailandensis]
MPFMLRAAGLPVETVRELRCPDSRRWADDVLDLADTSHATGETVADLLHALIGENDDESCRRTLLKLRREVFNNRLPKDAETVLALVSDLDPAAGRALADWLTARRLLADRQAEGAGLLAAETGRSRLALCRLAGEQRLRGGLPLASPSLDAQVDAYARLTAADPEARPDKKRRKIERSLLSYLYRTACKTSPFSTFTGVALGEFTEDPELPEQSEQSERPERPGLRTELAEEWDGYARINVVALGRLAEAVIADPARRADLPVALASGWGRDADQVRYVRRWVTAGDDDTAVTFDAIKDRLFFLRRSGTLERLLGLFEQRGTLRYGELTSWLVDDQNADAEECEQYLQTLLDLGMVQVPCLRTEVHHEDPLRAFQAALRDIDRPWADALATRLDALASCVDRFVSADPAERRGLLEELRTELRTIQEELRAEQGKVPQTVLYEDAAARGTVSLSARAWAELAAEPLRAVERLLPAFDLTLPQRILFKGFFLARYGRGGHCGDLLKLVHDFHEDFFDQYMSFTAGRTTFDAEGRYVPEENWLGLPELKALDTARLAFVERMRALWDAAGGRDEIALDDDFVADVAGELDSVTPRFAPMSHHLQVADRAGDPLIVLNRSYGGLSFPFSRFTHCFDGLDDRLLEQSTVICPKDAVFAEVTGGPVTTNLNLHGRLTEYEIVGPGETGTLAPEFQLRLDDLFIEHDEQEDRLVLCSARLGREVIPVYLGYLVPLALPELPRALLLLSPTSMAPLNVWGGIPEGEPTAGVTARPRVRHGSIVLSRRSWSAPVSALPIQAPGGSDADWFLGWHRFRRTHHLPGQVFATVSDSGARGATGAKPQYVDFDSPLSLAAFEALIKSDQARVVFREMLPDEDGLHVRSERGHHVAELAVETPPTPLTRKENAS